MGDAGGGRGRRELQRLRHRSGDGQSFEIEIGATIPDPDELRIPLGVSLDGFVDTDGRRVSMSDQRGGSVGEDAQHETMFPRAWREPPDDERWAGHLHRESRSSPRTNPGMAENGGGRAGLWRARLEGLQVLQAWAEAAYADTMMGAGIP